jgi:hypothetical protein
MASVNNEVRVIAALEDAVSARYALLVRFWILLLFLGFVGGNARASEDLQNSRAVSAGSGVPFAIADFDGDLLPDLASVQAGPNRSGTTDYRIQLQLSEVGRQSLRLVGPSGGLFIEARDVNGDHAVDLIVSSAWRRQPVAIFLNNGRGVFSRAELSGFPDAFTEYSEIWSPTTGQTKVAVGAPQNSRNWSCLERRIRPYVQSKANAISSLGSGFHFDSFLISNAGRAPPL